MHALSLYVKTKLNGDVGSGNRLTAWYVTKERGKDLDADSSETYGEISIFPGGPPSCRRFSMYGGVTGETPGTFQDTSRQTNFITLPRDHGAADSCCSC